MFLLKSFAAFSLVLSLAFSPHSYAAQQSCLINKSEVFPSSGEKRSLAKCRSDLAKWNHNITRLSYINAYDAAVCILLKEDNWDQGSLTAFLRQPAIQDQRVYDAVRATALLMNNNSLISQSYPFEQLAADAFDSVNRCVTTAHSEVYLDPKANMQNMAKLSEREKDYVHSHLELDQTLVYYNCYPIKMWLIVYLAIRCNGLMHKLVLDTDNPDLVQMYRQGYLNVSGARIFISLYETSKLCKEFLPYQTACEKIYQIAERQFGDSIEELKGALYASTGEWMSDADYIHYPINDFHSVLRNGYPYPEDLKPRGFSRFMQQKGADVNAGDNDGRTPADVATRQDNDSAARDIETDVPQPRSNTGHGSDGTGSGDRSNPSSNNDDVAMQAEPHRIQSHTALLDYEPESCVAFEWYEWAGRRTHLQAGAGEFINSCSDRVSVSYCISSGCGKYDSYYPSGTYVSPGERNPVIYIP